MSGDPFYDSIQDEFDSIVSTQVTASQNMKTNNLLGLGGLPEEPFVFLRRDFSRYAHGSTNARRPTPREFAQAPREAGTEYRAACTVRITEVHIDLTFYAIRRELDKFGVVCSVRAKGKIGNRRMCFVEFYNPAMAHEMVLHCKKLAAQGKGLPTLGPGRGGGSSSTNQEGTTRRWVVVQSTTAVSMSHPADMTFEYSAGVITQCCQFGVIMPEEEEEETWSEQEEGDIFVVPQTTHTKEKEQQQQQQQLESLNVGEVKILEEDGDTLLLNQQHHHDGIDLGGGSGGFNPPQGGASEQDLFSQPCELLHQVDEAGERSQGISGLPPLLFSQQQQQQQQQQHRAERILSSQVNPGEDKKVTDLLINTLRKNKQPIRTNFSDLEHRLLLQIMDNLVTLINMMMTCAATGQSDLELYVLMFTVFPVIYCGIRRGGAKDRQNYVNFLRKRGAENTNFCQHALWYIRSFDNNTDDDEVTTATAGEGGERIGGEDVGAPLDIRPKTREDEKLKKHVDDLALKDSQTLSALEPNNLAPNNELVMNVLQKLHSEVPEGVDYNDTATKVLLDYFNKEEGNSISGVYTKSDIQLALRNMNRHAAPGLSGWTRELYVLMLVDSTPAISDYLVHYMNMYLNPSLPNRPQHFRSNSFFFALLKVQAEDAADRPIGIPCFISKLAVKLALKRMKLKSTGMASEFGVEEPNVYQSLTMAKQALVPKTDTLFPSDQQGGGQLKQHHHNSSASQSSQRSSSCAALTLSVREPVIHSVTQNQEEATSLAWNATQPALGRTVEKRTTILPRHQHRPTTTDYHNLPVRVVLQGKVPNAEHSGGSSPLSGGVFITGRPLRTTYHSALVLEAELLCKDFAESDGALCLYYQAQRTITDMLAILANHRSDSKKNSSGTGNVEVGEFSVDFSVDVQLATMLVLLELTHGAHESAVAALRVGMDRGRQFALSFKSQVHSPCVEAESIANDLFAAIAALSVFEEEYSISTRKKWDGESHSSSSSSDDEQLLKDGYSAVDKDGAGDTSSVSKHFYDLLVNPQSGCYLTSLGGRKILQQNPLHHLPPWSALTSKEGRHEEGGTGCATLGRNKESSASSTPPLSRSSLHYCRPQVCCRLLLGILQPAPFFKATKGEGKTDE